MAKITKIWARQILDSRSMPTVEAACQLDNGFVAVASVPSGASTGSYEALELRDGDQANFWGKSVLKAVSNVNTVLGPAVVSAGCEAHEQQKIDDLLRAADGTENKSRLGANAILAVSEVVLKAGAASRNQTLYRWVNELAKAKGVNAALKVPTPLFNMINGGLHGAGNLDFQEFFVIPASTKSYSEGLRLGSEVYMAIGKNLERRGAIHSVGDEGGYAPNLFTNTDALEVMVESVRETSYQVGRDVFFGLDVASGTFYRQGAYNIRDRSTPLNEAAMVELYKEIQSRYHLAILEDPLYEDAWDGWKRLREELGGQIAIVGDDLLATNPKRVKKAIEEQACNAVLVKPNQIGTISETLDVIKLAHDAGWKTIVSHRSGETNEFLIADFACGVGADYVKFGAPARGERVAKYNRLLSIEAELKM